MATHISEINTSGRCGSLQTLAQSKEAYATLIKKEQRRALVASRITPSNQPSAEWLGPISRQHAEPELKAVLGDGQREHHVVGSQTQSPSYVMQLLLREQQKQSRHEAELRQFKRLGALQLVDPRISSPTLVPKFLGEPLSAQGSNVHVTPIKGLPSPNSIKEHLGAQKKSLFSDTNETALLRAKARKDRQLRHNQMIGNSVVDQSSTSPMFTTALRDPVDPEAVLLCDESVEDRKRLEQRNYAKRHLLGQFGDPPKTASGLGQESKKLPLLRSPNTNDRARSPSPERDVALLSLLQHQTKLLAKQVSLESVGAWDDADRERRKRNETLPDPKLVQNTADEEALVRRFVEDTGAVSFVAKTRRQLVLEQFEENRRSALLERSSKANQRRSLTSLSNSRRRGHQPSSLFPNNETTTKKRQARN